MSHHKVGDRLPLFQSPVVQEEKGSINQRSFTPDEPPRENIEPKSSETTDEELHNNPQFHRHAEATNAELFYDLFFVANLTVFTQVHEVNDNQTLAQYVGFFCILWFTWYQVGLYDIRFSMDSAFERIAKACQFGVMIGFAITGPNFSPGGSDDNDKAEEALTAFQALSFILMASRLVLMLQYLQSMYFTRPFRQTILPMGVIPATYFISAIIYMGLYFTFDGASADRAYIAWYVVAIFETIGTTLVASKWTVLSFRGTHLVQRMSLLTLIIFGEGVMVLAEKCQAIVKSELFEWNSSTIANVFCCILILYFLYMLYFDWIQEEHFSDIQQQIWAFLHFPLHLTLVLAVTGASQSVSWGAANIQSNQLDAEMTGYNLTYYNGTDNVIYHAVYNFTPAQWLDIAVKANDTATNVLSAALINAKEIDSTITLIGDLNQIQSVVGLVTNASQSKDATLTAVNALMWTYYTLETAVFELAGFSPPTNASVDPSNAFNTIDFTSDEAFTAISDEDNKIYSVFALTFVYFLVATGLVVILCTTVAALSKKEKRTVHWIRLAVSGIIGLALCLISLVATTADTNGAFGNLASGPGLLPMVLVALFAVVVLNSIRFPGKHRMPRLVPMRTRSNAGPH